MAGMLKLEDFGRLPPPRRVAAPAVGGAPAALAAPGRGNDGSARSETGVQRPSAGVQEAWDAGYRAGWDDAVRAAAEDEARLRADFAGNLRDLGFTYQEARAQVLASLEPLLREVTEQLLPDLAREGLAPRIIDALMARADTAAAAPVEIVIAPAARPALDRLMVPTPGLPVAVREEPTFDVGQAVLRIGQTETHVDLTAVVTAARDGIAALYALSQSTPTQERRHA
jgi:flagellar assembly protein FliH